MSYITAPRSVRVTPAWKRQTPRHNSPIVVTDLNGNVLRVEHVKEIKRKAKVAKRKATNKRKAKAKRAKVAKVKASRVEAVTPRITRAELDREFMRKLGSVHLDDN